MSASAVFDTICSRCGREAMLWGGDTCDVCDSDSNGLIDAEEMPHVSTVIDSHFISPEEKGWVIVPFRSHGNTVIPNWPNLSMAFREHVMAVTRHRSVKVIP